MSKFTGYPADALRFLKQLKKNNNREWFQENKARYESSIVQPSLDLISAMSKHFERFAPLFLAIPKKTGGSLMRIYRDTRFSKEKIPYKTNVGLHFRHRVGKDVHAPGFYLHVEPGGVFLGAGIWRPDPKSAQQIRSAIAENPAAWTRAARGKAFTGVFHLSGDCLKRPPRGFDADHPLIDDLKRKDFIGVSEVPDQSIQQAAFVKETAASMREALPLMKFLCDALSLPF